MLGIFVFFHSKVEVILTITFSKVTSVITDSESRYFTSLLQK